MSDKVYEIITDRIVEMLERGVVPWRKTWHVTGQTGGVMPEFTQAAYSKRGVRLYKGINQFLLSGKYASPFWLGYKGAQELGGNVKAGEKSSMVVYWKWCFTDNKTGARITEEEYKKLLAEYGEDRVEKFGYPFYGRVWNIEQCDGVPYPKDYVVKAPEAPVEPKTEAQKIEACEAILDAMAEKPVLTHGGNRAFYRPSTDSITLPPAESFEGPEEYYSTRFHEIAHWTGHKSRLNREGIQSVSFGSVRYSKEELIAEMTAAFLCDKAGVSQKVLENQAAYIGSWLKELKNDKKMVTQAAQAAMKAAEFIQRPKRAEAVTAAPTAVPA